MRTRNKEAEEQVLIASKRVCSMCAWFKDDWKPKECIQIAHIDRNHSNNDPSNLVVLCANHHAMYDSKSPQAKQVTPSELSVWKQKVEGKIEYYGRWVIVLSATIEEVDITLAEAIVTHLQEISKDSHLTLRRIEAGSVRLVLEGSLEGFNKIQNLFKSGQLIGVLGIAIEDMRWESEEDKQFINEYLFESGNMEKYRAFIAHSIDKKDKLVVESFLKILSQASIEGYLSELHPQPRPIPEKIRQNIEQADCLVAIITKKYKIEEREIWKTSDWIHNEIGMAYQSNKPILALVEENVEVGGLSKYTTELIYFDRINIQKSIQLISSVLGSLRKQIEKNRLEDSSHEKRSLKTLNTKIQDSVVYKSNIQHIAQQIKNKINITIKLPDEEKINLEKVEPIFLKTLSKYKLTKEDIKALLLDLQSTYNITFGKYSLEFIANSYLSKVSNRKTKINEVKLKKERKFIDESILEKEPSLKYFKDTFGPDILEVVRRNDKALEVCRLNQDILGSKNAKIVIVGSTGTGKTSIFNVLFGASIMPVNARSDVTDKIAKITLPSRLMVYDTPGVHGRKDVYENITRAFIGLSQRDSQYGRELKQYDSIPFCDLSVSEICEHRKEIDAVIKDGRIPHEIICKKGCPNFKILGLKHEELEDIDLIVVVYNLDCLRGEDEYLFKEIRSFTDRVLLVGNKLDLLDGKQKEEAISDIHNSAIPDEHFVAISTIRGINLDKFVEKIFMFLPEKAVDSFNNELDREFTKSRDFLINNYLRKIAAQACIVKVDKKLDLTKTTETEALLLGLMLKMGIDYSIGGEFLKDEMKSAVPNVYKEILEKRKRKIQRYEPKVIKEEIIRTKKEKVPVKKLEKVITGDHGPLGGATGVGAGAVIGTIVLPGVGTALGGMLGGIIGWIKGSSEKKYDVRERIVYEEREMPVREIIERVINVPTEIIETLRGGYDSTISILSFGRALKRTFELIEEQDSKTFNLGYFSQCLGEEAKSIEKNISPVKDKLNDATNWKEAFIYLSQIKFDER